MKLILSVLLASVTTVVADLREIGVHEEGAEIQIEEGNHSKASLTSVQARLNHTSNGRDQTVSYHGRQVASGFQVQRLEAASDVQDKSLYNTESGLAFELGAGLGASVEVQQSLFDVATDMLAPDGGEASVSQFVRSVNSKMDLSSAVETVQSAHSLTPDVAALVKISSNSSSEQAPVSEESMGKARNALNGLVEKAWKEMDDKIMSCKEFEEQNRDSQSQVVTDISQLVESITDLERIGTEALEGISDKDSTIARAQTHLETESRVFGQMGASNQAEMVTRQADLEIFQFILEFTRCGRTTALLQQSSESNSSARICQTLSGQQSLFFEDAKLQTKYIKMLTRNSKKVVSDLLEAFVTTNKLSVTVAQPAKSPVVGEHGMPCAAEADPMECMKSCSALPPDCGLLHDKLSLLWGDYKDKVDELQYQMNKNEFEFKELKTNLNEQLRLLMQSKARLSMLLSEGRSNLAMAREEKKEKEAQKVTLDQEYSVMMRSCKKRIMWIMYQDMCALIVVRNAVMEQSRTCPPAGITDCDVDKWIPADCSVSCDDKCPNRNDPYSCGGWQQVYRKVVVSNNDCGLQCPLLSRQKKCNQIKCPVDCAMSAWSGWGKCSADCEGGVQSKTRSVRVKPANGGSACNTVSDSRACNTGSCDRDCRLAPWTKWTPCTVGCGGGFQERHRHVLIPTRGFGKCPKDKSAMRYGKNLCNTNECVGDEICVAAQDLIIALDGSGSVTKQGFQTMKNYALKLVEHYKPKYFGNQAVKIGVLLFGNGRIMPDGQTVSPAINAQPLTFDFTEVKTVLSGLQFVKGFTNMAQGFSLAESMFTLGGRHGAQSAILVITDGKPSFNFQTSELVGQLDDKNVQRFFVMVAESAGPDLDLMKRWASSPWETNLLHVPGLSVLSADVALWTQKAIAMFCPLAFSPHQTHLSETLQGYMRVKEGGWCGNRGQVLSASVDGVDTCAALAKGAGKSGFLLGKSFRRGYCYAVEGEVSNGQYNEWTQNRVEPSCQFGWQESTIFDFYAMEPEATDPGQIIEDMEEAAEASNVSQGFSLW